MPFAPFHELFPDIARRETRSITTINSDDVPEAMYGLFELYCNERGCDCRRVVFHVNSPTIETKPGSPLATISFGWEPESFYRQWASFELDGDDLEELRGPALMRLAPQSRYAPALLDRIRSVLKDPAYVDRIVRHYQMYRDAIESGAGLKRKISMGWSDEKRKQRRRQRKRARRKRRSEPKRQGR